MGGMGGMPHGGGMAAGPMPAPGMGGAGGAAAANNAPQEAVCAEPKVFVGGVRFDVTQEDLQAHYGRYGALKNVALLKHLDSGKSKGCAMVLFERWTDAEAAVTSENGTQTELSNPRTAVVKFADPQRNEHGVLCGVTPKKLFIGQVFVAPRGGAGAGARSRAALCAACSFLVQLSRAAFACSFCVQRGGAAPCGRIAAASARAWRAACACSVAC